MKPLLLFDGYCLLCQASVHFILKYERDDSLQFAPLHAEISQKILSEHGLDSNYVDSLVFYNGKDCLVKSDAALMAASYLKFPWSILKFLGVLPKFLRDSVYDWIAKNRYRWFGKDTSCLLPTPELENRFHQDRIKID